MYRIRGSKIKKLKYLIIILPKSMDIPAYPRIYAGPATPHPYEKNIEKHVLLHFQRLHVLILFFI